MAYCSVCGVAMEDDASFCTYCGHRVTPQVVYVQQQPKPKVPGRGMGLASMIVGIIGASYALLVFLVTIIMVVKFSGRSYRYTAMPQIAMMVNSVIYSVFSILALVFQSVSKGKGFDGKMRKAGLITGVIGIILYGVSFAIALTM